MKVWMKGLRSDFSSSIHTRYRLKRKNISSYSLVAFGKCNLSCKFCFTGGGRKSHEGLLPDAKQMDFEEIIDFVIRECKEGKAIRISGGEPTLFPKETLRILKIVREHGGLSIVATNGTNHKIAMQYSKFL